MYARRDPLGDVWFEFRLFLRRLVSLPWHVYQFGKLERFRVGDYFLDGFGHPVFITEVTLFYSHWLGPWDLELAGVSILDGQTKSASVKHERPPKLGYETALVFVVLHQQLEEAAAEVFSLYERSPQLRAAWDKFHESRKKRTSWKRRKR